LKDRILIQATESKLSKLTLLTVRPRFIDVDVSFYKCEFSAKTF